MKCRVRLPHSVIPWTGRYAVQARHFTGSGVTVVLMKSTKYKKDDAPSSCQPRQYLSKSRILIHHREWGLYTEICPGRHVWAWIRGPLNPNPNDSSVGT